MPPQPVPLALALRKSQADLSRALPVARSMALSIHGSRAFGRNTADGSSWDSFKVMQCHLMQSESRDRRRSPAQSKPQRVLTLGAHCSMCLQKQTESKAPENSSGSDLSSPNSSTLGNPTARSPELLNARLQNDLPLSPLSRCTAT